MARVAGADIPNHKRIEVALRYVNGIGPTRAKRIVEQVGLEGNPRVKDLTEDELNRIREAVDKADYLVEGDLRREISQNIRRLIEIGSYRGSRHRRGLPSRGQRTRTNARSRRGVKKTVAGRKKVAAKK
ncbi:MAG: 30S ribosomal protein S13 [Dehalococcoidia bacterium]|nr:30S ribosomal protein S13 [Dehalococcoidia bacterium]